MSFIEVEPLATPAYYKLDKGNYNTNCEHRDYFAVTDSNAIEQMETKRRGPTQGQGLASKRDVIAAKYSDTDKLPCKFETGRQTATIVEDCLLDGLGTNVIDLTRW